MSLSPRIGVVIVTMGTRPRELEALLASVAKQDVPAARVVLVGNATSLDDVPTDVLDAAGTPGATVVTKMPLTENLGCPGGRNVGLELLRDAGEVDVVVELDDDGLLVATDVFREVRRHFEQNPRLGIIGFRVADEYGRTERRWVPRLRAGDPMRGGPVTAFLGGGHAFSVPMLRQIGLWPGEFFFGHEETDLAWRALDGDWEIHYVPTLVLQHPRTSPARHAVYYRFTARNRVWLARRRLPAPLVPVYLGVWITLAMVRMRSLTGLKAWWGGFAEGFRTPAGRRAPMRWRTVWRMTRLGRPPIL
ncbi:MULTISPECIES: glycosyltransferase [unclassified Streptomyces]|uniref:glycosyltransferase family 2 protein n=1 Tax=unclassified Streptomyces TaxID=2593676 RepID=UPI002ED5DCA2|nr:glycosyltransferase [Streptomyces sp. NBC_00891]WSY06376.1 glycosyltransferase [Streptomyces sp. NBC_00890]WSZ08000.1 glycosyltransferase [Streptomyces sp. NBC_00869]WSZ24500.1 glycosyltransferase [Streptomyces sp. NBC_00870]